MIVVDGLADGFRAFVALDGGLVVAGGGEVAATDLDGAIGADAGPNVASAPVKDCQALRNFEARDGAAW